MFALRIHASVRIATGMSDRLGGEWATKGQEFGSLPVLAIASMRVPACLQKSENPRNAISPLPPPAPPPPQAAVAALGTWGGRGEGPGLGSPSPPLSPLSEFRGGSGPWSAALPLPLPSTSPPGSGGGLALKIRHGSRGFQRTQEGKERCLRTK